MTRVCVSRSSTHAVLLAAVVALAACESTVPLYPAATPASSAPAPVADVPSQLAPPPPPAPPAVEPAAAPALPYGEAVAARFPAPPIVYRTPGLQEGRAEFTSNAEMQAAVHALAREGASVLTLGTSQNGQPLEGLLFSREPDSSPAGLARAGRPTVLVIGQQHGDEPAAGEAVLVLAQELARGPLRRVLDRINVVLVPRANPDGAQAGQRLAANGIDINRDHLLLRSPEARALSRLVRDYQPAVVVDAHEYTVAGRFLEKFGAVQRYDALVQYATTGNLHEFVTKAADEWFRQPMLRRLQGQGLSAEWYYTTSSDLTDKTLSMGGMRPDTGRNVNGLKNAVSILVETRGVGIGRLHAQRRVHTQVTAISSILQSAADRGADLMKLRQYVQAAVSAQACQGRVVVDAGLTPSEHTIQMLDPQTGADRPLTANWNSALVLTELKARTRPCGYWLAADQGDAAARLRDLGVRVEQVGSVGVLQGETYAEASRREAMRQDVRGTIADAAAAVQVEAQTVSALIDVGLGSYYVPMSQPLAHLAVAALEPDTQSSYFANGIVTGLDKVARVVALPGVRLTTLP